MRPAELHSEEYVARMFPPLENHRAAFRDAMREMVADMEERSPGEWQRICDGLIRDDIQPLSGPSEELEW